MNNKKIVIVGNYKIELTIPDLGRDLKYSSDNNINAFDNNGNLIWNISELLKTYSNNNRLKYYEDMYFDIRALDDEKIFCTGFINHCEIDLKTNSIIRIVTNR